MFLFLPLFEGDVATNAAMVPSSVHCKKLHTMYPSDIIWIEIRWKFNRNILEQLYITLQETGHKKD